MGVVASDKYDYVKVEAAQIEQAYNHWCDFYDAQDAYWYTTDFLKFVDPGRKQLDDKWYSADFLWVDHATARRIALLAGPHWHTVMKAQEVV